MAQTIPINNSEAIAIESNMSLEKDITDCTTTAISNNGSGDQQANHLPSRITNDGIAGINVPPITKITPSTITGEARLTAIFDGSDSSDIKDIISSVTSNFSKAL